MGWEVGIGTHALYTVTASTNIPGYEAGSIQVKRRYSEFVTLYWVRLGMARFPWSLFRLAAVWYSGWVCCEACPDRTLCGHAAA